jgi:hypothetical protein
LIKYFLSSIIMEATPSENSEVVGDLQVYREISGGTAYVPGRGADMVPGMVGHGGIGTYLSRPGQNTDGLKSPVVDEVLFTLPNLSRAQVEVVRTAIADLEDRDEEVTEVAVRERL